MWTRMLLPAATLVLAAAALCGAFPTHIYKQATSPGAFIGEGINHIASALLQDAEQQGNAAFSPLGHSAILAALAEGAGGKTRSQLLAALMLPQDSSLTRATYRSVLGRMKEKNAMSKPEFRSWFYVYKKSAHLEEAYTNTLRDSYLMEVRDIEDAELDTPTEFFTKKEQEVQQDSEKPEPVLDENKVNAEVPVAVVPDAVPVAVPVAAPVAVPVAVPVAAPVAEPVAAPVAVPVAVPETHPAAEKDQVEPVVVVPEQVQAAPIPAAGDAAEGVIAKPQEEPGKPEAAPLQANCDPAVVSAHPVVESAPASGDSSDIAAAPHEKEDEQVAAAVTERQGEQEQEPAVPAQQSPAPQEVADEVPVVEAASVPPAEQVTATAAPPPSASPVVPAVEVVPTPPSGAEPPPPALAAEAGSVQPSAPPAEGGVGSPTEAPPTEPVAPVVTPATELLPPVEDASKKDDAKKETTAATGLNDDAVEPVKVVEATAEKIEQIQDKIPAEVEISNPANEVYKEEAGDVPEKVSLAKFSKLGLPKDEKKPTNVAKPEKKKDEKKKASRNSADADTDGRQPASGPSLLTAFNALYYKGVWQTPFDAKFRDDFLVGEGVKKEVTVLRTQGDFRIGEIKELDARAIELPYKGENGRYSLLVLLPLSPDGLDKMTEALTRFSFRQLGKYMRQKHVDVTIPEFEIDCISHPQNVFRKLGVTAMLDKDTAEFPGISKAQRLYLQDDAMAQLVRFRLDDETAVANYLSTMSMTTRSGNQVFQANHPFVFYLRDNLDNLTVVVGKVVDPSIRPEFSALEE